MSLLLGVCGLSHPSLAHNFSVLWVFVQTAAGGVSRKNIYTKYIYIQEYIAWHH